MTELETRKNDVMTARVTLLGRIEEIKDRVSPKIVTDAVRQVTRRTVHSVAQDSMRTARRRPLAVAGAGLAAALWIFRKPIANAWRSVRQKERNDD